MSVTPITNTDLNDIEYNQLPASLQELLVTTPHATFIGRASGDSMQGQGIFDGDILIIFHSLRPQNNDVIAATINGEFVCKQLDTAYCDPPIPTIPPCRSVTVISLPSRE